MKNRTFVTLLAIIAIPVALYLIIVWIETESLKPISANLGVAPTKVALIDYTTSLLVNRIGSQRSDIHTMLENLGGEFTFVDHSEGRLPEEHAYWTMGRVPWGKMWAVWILEYDESDKLKGVSVGSS